MATSVDDIASPIGMSRANVYRFVPSMRANRKGDLIGFRLSRKHGRI